MENRSVRDLGEWLRDRLKMEGLSLRQAATKTGLSHATISDLMKGAQASAETIKKLAQAFGDDHHQRLALEDELLILAGYRSRRPEGEEFSEPMARLLDKISQFNEEKLKIMEHFADYISKTGRK